MREILENYYRNIGKKKNAVVRKAFRGGRGGGKVLEITAAIEEIGRMR